MHRIESRTAWSTRPRQVRKTADSVIELQIVPGLAADALIVRARHRLSMHADRVRRRRRGAGITPATSWPMASVARISLPTRPKVKAPEPPEPPEPPGSPPPHDPCR